MISRTRERVLIACDDGTVEPFKTEELQSMIYRACIECGFDDNWLSEDIALSVEYLIIETGDKMEYSKEEIFAFASKMLEETGHGNIANRFRKNCGISLALELECQLDSIRDFLLSDGTLGSDLGKIGKFASLVFSALKQIGVSKVEKSLVLALARHCAKVPEDKVARMFTAGQQGNILIHKEQLAEELLAIEGIANYIRSSAISFHPVSIFFPSLKVSFCFAKFAGMKDLASPLTELSLMPHLAELAEVLERCRAHVSSIALRAGCVVKIPIILRVVDSVEFAKEFMCSSSENDECVREMLSVLRELVDGELVIK